MVGLHLPGIQRATLAHYGGRIHCPEAHLNQDATCRISAQCLLADPGSCWESMVRLALADSLCTPFAQLLDSPRSAGIRMLNEKFLHLVELLGRLFPSLVLRRTNARASQTHALSWQKSGRPAVRRGTRPIFLCNSDCAWGVNSNSRSFVSPTLHYKCHLS